MERKLTKKNPPHAIDEVIAYWENGFFALYRHQVDNIVFTKERIKKIPGAELKVVLGVRRYDEVFAWFRRQLKKDIFTLEPIHNFLVENNIKHSYELSGGPNAKKR